MGHQLLEVERGKSERKGAGVSFCQSAEGLSTWRAIDFTLACDWHPFIFFFHTCVLHVCFFGKDRYSSHQYSHVWKTISLQVISLTFLGDRKVIWSTRVPKSNELQVLPGIEFSKLTLPI